MLPHQYTDSDIILKIHDLDISISKVKKHGAKIWD